MKIARFEFSLFGINTYAVFDPDSKECAIIDPGMSTYQERKAVERFITDNGLKLTHIINTHLHIDHAIGNFWLKSHFPAPVEAHDSDLPLGLRMTEQAAMFGIPSDSEAVEIDQCLHDGDFIRIGSGFLQVIHVPGHSKGSIALYDKADGFLISGDALFAGSVGRSDLPGGNGKELINSISTRLLTLPSDTVVYPGHGPATTIGHEAATNPFLR